MLFAPLIVPRLSALIFGSVHEKNTRGMGINQTRPPPEKLNQFGVALQAKMGYLDFVGFLKRFAIPLSPPVASKLIPGCGEPRQNTKVSDPVRNVTCLTDLFGDAPLYFGDDRFEFRAVPGVELPNDEEMGEKNPLLLLSKANSKQGDHIVGPRVLKEKFKKEDFWKDDPLSGTSWPFDPNTRWLVFAVLKKAIEAHGKPIPIEEAQKIKAKFFVGPPGSPQKALPAPPPSSTTTSTTVTTTVDLASSSMVAGSSITEIKMTDEEAKKHMEEMQAAKESKESSNKGEKKKHHHKRDDEESDHDSSSTHKHSKKSKKNS
jgi:hypothetical protein